MPTRWLLLRTKSGTRLDDALKHGNVGGLAKVLDSNQTTLEWKNSGEGDFAMARLSKLPVLVLSQTCDIQNKTFIQVAPIFPVDADPQYIEKLKSDEVISAFWLQAHSPELPKDSYADWELIQAVHHTYIKRIRQNQHFRLSAARTRLLQRSITKYFGRPNSFDAESDTVPRSGSYLCVTCFYLDARVTQVNHNLGEKFRNCGICNGRGWVMKGR